MMPHEVDVKVKAIECNNQQADYAYSGQIANISLQLPKDFDPTYIKSGTVLCDPLHPIYKVRRFRANILVHDVDQPLTKGQQTIVFTFSNKVSGKVQKLEHKLDKDRNPINPGKKLFALKQNDFASVIIKLEEKICLEIFKNNKTMGRVALMGSMNTTAEDGKMYESQTVIAAGTITQLMI